MDLGLIFSSSYFKNVAVLIALIIGLTLFKIADCKPFKEDGEAFDGKKLLKGLGRHVFAIIALSVVFVIGESFGKDLLLITINNTELTIQEAIDVIMFSADALFGAKLIKNALAFFGIKGSENVKEEVDIQDIIGPQTVEEEKEYLG